MKDYLILLLSTLFFANCFCQNCKITSRQINNSIYVSEGNCNKFPEQVIRGSNTQFVNIFFSNIDTLMLCYFPDSLLGFDCFGNIKNVPCGKYFIYLEEFNLFLENGKGINDFPNIVNSLPSSLKQLGFNLSDKNNSLTWLIRMDVESLSINFNKKNPVNCLNEIIKLKKLKSLNIVSALINSGAISIIQKKPIKELKLTNCSIKNNFYSNLFLLDSLQHLSFSNNKKAPKYIKQYTNLSQLKKLEFIDCDVKSFPFQLNTFESLKYIHINTLNLDSNTAKEIQFEKLDSIRVRHSFINGISNGDYWPETQCKIYFNVPNIR